MATIPTSTRPMGICLGGEGLVMVREFYLFPDILPGVTRTYLAVVAVQIIVLLALWWFSQHFGV